MEKFRIELIDGRVIDGILKADQPKEVKTDSLQLDTSGRYLSFGKRKSKVLAEDQMIMAERQYDHHLFTENAWFLLANAEKIFSDSRMFLAPVKIVNGLAYTGTSGFRCPTVGVYLEWWLNYKEPSVDGNGNLVWYISGSPLSGMNCCSSVTPDGEQVKIVQHTSFSAIWGSFMEVNNRYTEAKQRCEAYSLEEVLIKLHGDNYRYSLIDLKHEMIERIMDRDKCQLQRLYDRLVARTQKLIKDNRKLQLRTHREQIMEFYKDYSERHKVIHDLEQRYAKRHNELRRQLHDGTLQGDYHVLLADASREYRERKREQSDLLNRFIRTTFGKNPNGITPTDVIRFASGKPLSFTFSLY